jgi:hypothetical protein
VSREKYDQVALYLATVSLQEIEKKLNDNIRKIEPYSRRKKQIGALAQLEPLYKSKGIKLMGKLEVGMRKAETGLLQFIPKTYPAAFQ